MGRIRITVLERVTHEQITRLVGGYRSEARYLVRWREARGEVRFVLTRTALKTPYVKVFRRPRSETREYQDVVRQGWSLGAYEEDRLVGLAIAEPQLWNRAVWVWELGVAASHRRRGIGRRLLEAVSRHAARAGYRTLVCETQATNAPAIDFYRSVGFRMEGVDVSYYSNDDLETGDVSVFMKRHVPETRRPRESSRARPRHTSE